MSTSQPEKLIVFLKAPRLGTVKTRIAKSLGDDEALRIYRSLVETVLGKMTVVPRLELRHTPDDAVTEIQPWLRPNWSAAPQGTGDLGARMHRAFQEAFASGAQRVVLIGSDSPEITPQDIHSAWQALEDYDVVLGPATDGGYWLIALRAPQPSLFENMKWSTETVLKETQSRSATTGLKSHLLRALSDVDTAEDWHRFQSRQLTPPPSQP